MKNDAIEWRIYLRINLVIENLKKYIEKNINIILLFVAIPIIGIGISMIYDANQEQEMSNFITIYPLSAPHGYFLYNDTSIEFNSSKPISLPDYFPEFIQIELKYKEPVMRGDHLNLNEVCTRVRDSYQNENIHRYKMDLELNGWSSEIDSNFPYKFQQDIANFPFNESEYEFYNITRSRLIETYDQNGMRFLFRPSHTFCSEFGGKPLIFKEPNSSDHFDFSYFLLINDEDKAYILMGKAILHYPIKSANRIEELSIRTNKKILILTGWLLILGSFPFILSIRQLLRNN